MTLLKVPDPRLLARFQQAVDFVDIGLWRNIDGSQLSRGTLESAIQPQEPFRVRPEMDAGVYAARDEELVSGVTRSEQWATHDWKPVRLPFRNDDVQEAEPPGIER